MGGKVFSSGEDPLDTPRMSPAEYRLAKGNCTSSLETLGFSRIAIPIEAPEKDSFGDVDILVCLEGTQFPPSAQFDASAWDRIERTLRAVRSHSWGRFGPDKQLIIDNKSLAIPWPHVVASEPAGQKEEPGAQSKPRYIQVDIRLCDSRGELDWRLYKHNHGDLWNMIGQTIRPFGLTADEFGLHIRIPEIEKEDKKKARVLLTRDPTKANDFLGLSRPGDDWGKPFKSANALFEHAANCRWFMLWPRDRDVKKDGATHDGIKDKAGKETADKETEKRMEQRPLFDRWIREFIPACRTECRFMVSNPEERTPETVRDQVRQQAFEAFPGSEVAYNAKLADWNKEKTRIHVKNGLIKGGVCLPEDIKPYLPVPRDRDGDEPGDKNVRLLAIERQWRSTLRSALEKVIINDDDSFEGVVPPKLRDKDGVLRVDEIKDWIKKNWADVGRVAWKRQCDRARDHMDREIAKDEGRTG